MVNPELAHALIVEVERLGPAEQREVLEFARTLSGRGVVDPSGKDILTFAGSFDPADLTQMAEAIEESCEQVRPDEW